MTYGFTIGDRPIDDAGDIHPLMGTGYARLGSYVVVGASTAGTLHLAHDFPRDDAFVVRASGDWLAVGVSDGVGSRSLSRYGATFTAASLVRHMLRQVALPLHAELRGGSSQPGKHKPAIEVPRDLEDFSLRISSSDSNGVEGSAVDGLLREIGSIGWAEARRSRNGAESIADVPTGTEANPSQDRAPGPAMPPSGDLDGAPITLDSVTLSKSTRNSENGLPTDTDVSAPAEHQALAEGAPAEGELALLIHNAFERTFEGLQRHAEELGVNPTDISCTAVALLLNVVDGRWVTAQVGDGAIIALRASGEAEELGPDDENDDLQKVYTITHDDWHKHFSCKARGASESDPVTAFFVMTDGVANDVIYSPAPQALPKWASGVERNVLAAPTCARAAAGMLQWLATYKAQGSFDDRTLVVVTRSEDTDGGGDVTPRGS